MLYSTPIGLAAPSISKLIPLDSISISITIEDVFVSKRLEVTYCNMLKESIESEFFAFIPKTEQLTSITFKLNEEVILTSDTDATETKELTPTVYSNTLSQISHPNVDCVYSHLLQAAQIPLKQNQRLTVTMNLLSFATLDKGEFFLNELRLSPELIPDPYLDEKTKLSFSLGTYPLANPDSSYDWHLKITISSRFRIEAIESSSHELLIETNEEQTLATLTPDNIPFEEFFSKDFKLQYSLKTEDKIFGRALKENDDLWNVMVGYPQKKTAEDNPKEKTLFCSKKGTVFIIDCGGSMYGEKLEAVKIATIIALKSLPIGSFFNIIAFDSEINVFSKDLLLNDDKNVNTAINFVQSLKARARGASLSELFETLFEDPKLLRLPIDVYVLSDYHGFVNQNVIDLVAAKPQNFRINALGIEKLASKEAACKVAKVGNGKSAFAGKPSEVPSAFAKLFHNTLDSALTRAVLAFDEEQKGAEESTKSNSVWQGECLVAFERCGKADAQSQEKTAIMSFNDENQKASKYQQKVDFSLELLEASFLTLARKKASAIQKFEVNTFSAYSKEGGAKSTLKRIEISLLPLVILNYWDKVVEDPYDDFDEMIEAAEDAMISTNKSEVDAMKEALEELDKGIDDKDMLDEVSETQFGHKVAEFKSKFGKAKELFKDCPELKQLADSTSPIRKILGVLGSNGSWDGKIVNTLTLKDKDLSKVILSTEEEDSLGLTRALREYLSKSIFEPYLFVCIEKSASQWV